MGVGAGVVPANRTAILLASVSTSTCAGGATTGAVVTDDATGANGTTAGVDEHALTDIDVTPVESVGITGDAVPGIAGGAELGLTGGDTEEKIVVTGATLTVCVGVDDAPVVRVVVGVDTADDVVVMDAVVTGGPP